MITNTKSGKRTTQREEHDTRQRHSVRRSTPDADIENAAHGLQIGESKDGLVRNCSGVDKKKICTIHTSKY